MAVTQLYTAVSGDTITSARWNNEFGNIYNNGTAIAFPLTTAVSAAGFALTLDAAAVTTLLSSAAVAYIMTPGAKSGTPGPGAAEGSAINVVAHTFTDTATAASGTAAEYSTVSIQRSTLAATNSLVTTTDAATLYINNAPAAGTNETITNAMALWVDNGAVRLDGLLLTRAGLSGTVALGGHIYGLTFDPGTDATNDIDIAVGGAVSDDAAVTDKRLMNLTSVFTKQSDAVWAVGSAAGMLDTGVVGDSDYYLFLIQRADTGVVDALCSLSSTAPTMPTSYAFKRLIGWFKRTGGTIVDFLTYETSGGGIHYVWVAPTLDVDLANTLTTSERTDAAKVPLNISTEALLHVTAEDAATTSCFSMYNPDVPSVAPSLTVAPLSTMKTQVADVLASAQVTVRTDATGLIAARANVATYDAYAFVTLGFNWSRR